MSQQVVIAGAMFNDVPAISVPDANNVYHSFLDTTIAINAAQASDITNGKLAYVNGSLVTGTNSGGGGGALKIGVLRPDAVLEQSWTYDKYIVANESVTLPAYSTSLQTLKSSQILKTGQALDLTTYDYVITARALSYPTYSSSTKGKGRFEYAVNASVWEISCVPSSSMSALGTTASRYYNALTQLNTANCELYWGSATALYSANQSYGTYQTFISPAYTASDTGAATVNINSPTLAVRGNNTYFASTYWGYMTDIRYQYIIELWKIPRTGTVYGYGNTSQLRHAIVCAQGTGTLT